MREVLSSSSSSSSSSLVLLVLSLFLISLIPPVYSIPNRVCVSQDTGSNSGHITGKQSPQGERQWVVLLWINCNLRLTTCEGSLISKDWVLTSASCLPCGSDASVVIDIGLYHSDIRHDMIHNQPVSRIGADKIIIHPKYEGVRKNDLALLHLSAPVNSSFTIKLIDCAKMKHDKEKTHSFLSSGWGRSWLYSSLEAKPLHDVYLYMWTNEKCNGALGDNAPASNSFFCAGVKDPQNTRTSNAAFSGHQGPCFVNHGSPLVTQSARVLTKGDGSLNILCEWRLCGVLTYGLSCGTNGLPGYFMDLCHYESWLSETMKQEKGEGG